MQPFLSSSEKKTIEEGIYLKLYLAWLLALLGSQAQASQAFPEAGTGYLVVGVLLILALLIFHAFERNAYRSYRDQTAKNYTRLAQMKAHLKMTSALREEQRRLIEYNNSMLMHWTVRHGVDAGVTILAIAGIVWTLASYTLSLS